VALTFPPAIFAADLDGTLVDRADRVHPRDREAIARARAMGVVVTIATGRLTSRTHPVARDLGLDAPLVCADGGVIACGATERVLARRAIAVGEVERILGALVRHGASVFVFTHESIHGCQRGHAYHTYVSGWSHEIVTYDDVLSAEVWRSGPVMVVGIAPREAVAELEAALGAGGAEVEVLRFAGGGAEVFRFVSRGVSKGSGLADVAKRVGVARERVCVIGDWYNDLPMFDWAARSFAMPHAPADVKRRASDVLDAGDGVIATALDAWLAALV
jgi:Cof subfamily protein (haloacid dehalogenase superfamily)